MTRTGGRGGARPIAGSGQRASTAGRGARPPAGRRGWFGRGLLGRRWPAGIRLAAKITAGTLGGLVLLAGLLYGRLLMGPVSLGFLAHPIEESIGHEVAGLAVKIETVALQIGERGQIEVALKNVRVSDADDVVLALAPSAAISLSRRALLSGRLAPESVDLISPRLLLFYNDEGTLSLKFSPPGDAPVPDSHGKSPDIRGPVDASSSSVAEKGSEISPDVLGRIDLVKVLAQASASARRRENASAYLREIGLRSATVIVDNGARKSIWRVPELDVDLDHRRSRSSIAGRAKIESLTGPWEVNFRTYERASAQSIALNVSVQGLVPRGLARALPQLGVLEGIDVPIWGEGRMALSPSGEIVDGKIEIDAAPGQVVLPWLGAAPLRIDGAHLELAYARATRRFDIAPSVLVWGDSRVQFSGNAVYGADRSGEPGWNVTLNSEGGWLGAEPPLYPRLSIDDWSAHGFIAPVRGRAALDAFSLRIGGADVSAQGEVSDVAGVVQARLDGKIGPMSAATLKSIWPATLAPQTRGWVAQHLVRGHLQGGAFKLSSDSREGAGGWAATTGAPERASLTLEAAGIALNIAEGAPLLEVPRALLRVDDRALEITVPDAGMAAPDGRKLAVKGTFSVDLSAPAPRTGQVTAKLQGPVSLALEIANGEPFNALRGTDINIASIDGKVDSQLAIAVPLTAEARATDAKVEGKIRISDGRVRQAVGPHDITGANINIDLMGSAVEARGEMLINGVLAKANMQHVFGVPAEKQPPLKITAKLDDSDRTQLGLDINDLVQGEVGIEITVARDAHNVRHVHLRADLVNADVVLDSVAFRKPRGRAAVFQFDVGKGAGAYPIELHNVTMVADNVALQGWMGVGHDHKIKEYRFPSFSLNTVSSLEVYGKARDDGVWDVTAKGSRYDGRDLFRAMFDIAHPPPNTKVKPGFDLRAEVGTVIGFNDTSLQGVRMTLHKRLNKTVAMDVRGTLEGGKAFAAVLRPEPNQPRRLLAESMDAGRTFKLVGFYPNAVGGAMNLEVNLDGEGAAERVGTLWVKDFAVLGDPIVSQVLKNADDPSSSQRSGRNKTAVVRERFDFEQMRGRFSIGHGQFVLHGAYMQGPLVGATMKGKVDFRSQTLNMGGTYIPLSGLNRVIGDLLPMFRPILTGPQGEGIFGITFAIQGAMADPQVIVNPLALIAPGIFREVFQMTPEDPRVLPPAPAPAPRSDAGPRASSVPASAKSAGGGGSSGAEIGGSWDSTSSPTPSGKRK